MSLSFQEDTSQIFISQTHPFPYKTSKCTFDCHINLFLRGQKILPAIFVFQLLAACALVATASADFVGHSHRGSHNQVLVISLSLD